LEVEEGEVGGGLVQQPGCIFLLLEALEHLDGLQCAQARELRPEGTRRAATLEMFFFLRYVMPLKISSSMAMRGNAWCRLHSDA
jgi:hypothetical protein